MIGIVIAFALITEACKQTQATPSKEQAATDSLRRADSLKTVDSLANVGTPTIVAYVLNGDFADYPNTAARRFIKDSIKPDPNDVTRNIRQPDTTYSVFIKAPIYDSVGARVKNKRGGDSVIIDWVRLRKDIIIHDFNVPYTKFIRQIPNRR